MKLGGTWFSNNSTRLELLWFRSTDATLNDEDGISNSCNKIILGKGSKKIDFFLGKSPKLWVGGGQDS